MLNDDTQRYGLLKDDALIILCTDFKIGVYIYKSFLHIPDIWERHLAATAHPPPRDSASAYRLALSCKHESSTTLRMTRGGGGESPPKIVVFAGKI